MEQSSQTAPARRRPQPWTAKEQALVEVAAACGCEMADMCKLLRRHRTVIINHLDANAAKRAAKRRENYAANNYDKILTKNKIYSRGYRMRYPDRARESSRRNAARQRAKDPAKYKERMKAYYRANPSPFKLRVKNRNAIKRAGAIYSSRVFTSEEHALRFSQFSDCCAYCGEKQLLTLDHVLALSRGGLHEASNIVPACLRCNCSKRAALVEVWYRRQPFFTEERWRKIQRHCPAAVAGQLPLAPAA